MIKQILDFIIITDKTIWQDVILSSLLIPLFFWIILKLRNYFYFLRPLQSLFKDFLKNKEETLIFLSQKFAADDDYNLKEDQKYITRYPNPIPNNKLNFGKQCKKNIGTVWSESEGECLADIFNILGGSKKIEGIRVGDLVKDWEKWSNPMFLVGFNPKTEKIMQKTDKINFEKNNQLCELKLKNNQVVFSCSFPFDAGVIQKIFLSATDNAVFILAGLGTAGTAATGYFLRKNAVELGKMYGNKNFCCLIKIKADEGKSSIIEQRITPKPKWSRIFFHPITYFKFIKKFKF